MIDNFAGQSFLLSGGPHAMGPSDARQRMSEIQRIMERTTLNTVLPGWPAILAGLLALAGCAASYAMLGSMDFAALLYKSAAVQWGFCGMWAAIGIVNPATFAKHRPYAIVVASILAAMLTPPDVMSMMMLMLPVVLLYEVGILVGRLVWKKRAAST